MKREKVNRLRLARESQINVVSCVLLYFNLTELPHIHTSYSRARYVTNILPLIHVHYALFLTFVNLLQLYDFIVITI